MLPRRLVAIAATAVLGVGLWAAAPPTQGAEPKSPKPAPPTSPAPRPAPATPAPARATVVPVETLTLEQFQRLRDSAVIEVGGTRTTAGELRAKARVALVVDVNDPEGAGRIKVKFPWVRGDVEAWALVSRPLGGSRTALPEIGDEVIVGFEHGDVQSPIVLGSLWNGKGRPPR